MGAPKGHPRYGGRVKGQPNKTTITAKESILKVAEKLGGVQRIVDWVQKDESGVNERVFWSQIYTKLIPLINVGDKEDGDFEFVLMIGRRDGNNAKLIEQEKDQVHETLALPQAIDGDLQPDGFDGEASTLQLDRSFNEDR